MRRTGAVARWLDYVVAGFLGGLIAGGVVWTLETQAPEFISTATLQVVPEVGTGDPDRIVASEVNVVASRAVRETAAESLGVDPQSFVVEAEQLRLSNSVRVSAEATTPEEAQAITSAVIEAYLARQGGLGSQSAAVVLDGAGAGTPSRSPARDVPAGVLGGIIVGAAVIALKRSLAPPLRGSYVESPVPAPMVELPLPRLGPRSRRSAEGLADVLRTTVHFVADGMSPGTSRARLFVIPLVAARTDLARWVTEAVGSGTAPWGRSDSEPGGGAVDADFLRPPILVPDSGNVSVQLRREATGGALDEMTITVVIVVARTWVDSEASLRKAVASASVFAHVMVVLLGSDGSGFVLPAEARPIADDVPGGDRRRNRPDRRSAT